MCRGEVAHADVDAHLSFLKAAITSGEGWEGPAMGALEPRDDAAVVTLVYLGRNADSLVEPVPLEALDMPPPEDR